MAHACYTSPAVFVHRPQQRDSYHVNSDPYAGSFTCTKCSTLSARERTGDADSRSKNEDEWSPWSCLRRRHAVRPRFAPNRREVATLLLGRSLLHLHWIAGASGREYACPARGSR